MKNNNNKQILIGPNGMRITLNSAFVFINDDVEVSDAVSLILPPVTIEKKNLLINEDTADLIPFPLTEEEVSWLEAKASYVEQWLISAIVNARCKLDEQINADDFITA